MAMSSTGYITQVVGPVVDVHFDQKASDLAEFGNVKLGDPISIIENRSYDYAVSTANYAMAKMAYDDVDEEAEM